MFPSLFLYIYIYSFICTPFLLLNYFYLFSFYFFLTIKKAKGKVSSRINIEPKKSPLNRKNVFCCFFVIRMAIKKILIAIYILII